jgi:hypothetical protein
MLPRSVSAWVKVESWATPLAGSRRRSRVQRIIGTVLVTLNEVKGAMLEMVPFASLRVTCDG